MSTIKNEKIMELLVMKPRTLLFHSAPPLSLPSVFSRLGAPLNSELQLQTVVKRQDLNTINSTFRTDALMNALLW